MRIQLSEKEYKTKLRIKVNITTKYSRPVPLGLFTKEITNMVINGDKFSKMYGVENYGNSTSLVYSNYQKSMVDFVERFSAERNFSTLTNIGYLKVKYSVCYPLSDYAVDKITARVNYLLAYKDSTEHRFYPIFIVRRSDNKLPESTITYFTLIMPLYDFASHCFISKSSHVVDSIIVFVRNSLYDVIGDTDYCNEIDFRLLNKIYRRILYYASKNRATSEYVARKNVDFAE